MKRDYDILFVCVSSFRVNKYECRVKHECATSANGLIKSLPNSRTPVYVGRGALRGICFSTFTRTQNRLTVYHVRAQVCAICNLISNANSVRRRAPSCRLLALWSPNRRRAASRRESTSTISPMHWTPSSPSRSTRAPLITINAFRACAMKRAGISSAAIIHERVINVFTSLEMHRTNVTSEARCVTRAQSGVARDSRAPGCSGVFSHALLKVYPA